MLAYSCSEYLQLYVEPVFVCAVCVRGKSVKFTYTLATQQRERERACTQTYVPSF